MYDYDVIIRSIYDGDTCRVDIDLGHDIWIHNQSIRYAGINTPELKGEERELGKISRNEVRRLMPIGNKFVMRSVKKDKYGRWLGIFFNYNEWYPGIEFDKSINTSTIGKSIAAK